MLIARVLSQGKDMVIWMLMNDEWGRRGLLLIESRDHCESSAHSSMAGALAGVTNKACCYLICYKENYYGFSFRLSAACMGNWELGI